MTDPRDRPGVTDYMEAMFSEPEGQAFIQSALEDMAPKLAASALTLHLIPHRDGTYHPGDVKLWVELGAALMMGKPIVLVVNESTVLPEKVEQIADEIIRLKPGDLDRNAKAVVETFVAAMDRLIK